MVSSVERTSEVWRREACLLPKVHRVVDVRKHLGGLSPVDRLGLSPALQLERNREDLCTVDVNIGHPERTCRYGII